MFSDLRYSILATVYDSRLSGVIWIQWHPNRTTIFLISRNILEGDIEVSENKGYVTFVPILDF